MILILNTFNPGCGRAPGCRKASPYWIPVPIIPKTVPETSIPGGSLMLPIGIVVIRQAYDNSQEDQVARCMLLVL